MNSYISQLKFASCRPRLFGASKYHV